MQQLSAKHDQRWNEKKRHPPSEKPNARLDKPEGPSLPQRRHTVRGKQGKKKKKHPRYRAGEPDAHGAKNLIYSNVDRHQQSHREDQAKGRRKG